MIRLPTRSTLLTPSFPTRRSSDLQDDFQAALRQVQRHRQAHRPGTHDGNGMPLRVGRGARRIAEFQGLVIDASHPLLLVHVPRRLIYWPSSSFHISISTSAVPMHARAYPVASSYSVNKTKG